MPNLSKAYWYWLPLLAVSCASAPKLPPGTRYVVTVPKAPFYRYGPAQSYGADLQLQKGQRVTMLENSFGFSHVVTDEGTAGYVSSEEIAPAPAEAATPVPKPAKPGKPDRGPKPGADFSREPSPLELSNLPQPALPQQDPSPPPPNLKFRY